MVDQAPALKNNSHVQVHTIKGTFNILRTEKNRKGQNPLTIHLFLPVSFLKEPSFPVIRHS